MPFTGPLPGGPRALGRIARSGADGPTPRSTYADMEELSPIPDITRPYLRPDEPPEAYPLALGGDEDHAEREGGGKRRILTVLSLMLVVIGVIIVFVVDTRRNRRKPPPAEDTTTINQPKTVIINHTAKR